MKGKRRGVRSGNQFQRGFRKDEPAFRMLGDDEPRVRIRIKRGRRIKQTGILVDDWDVAWRLTYKGTKEVPV